MLKFPKLTRIRDPAHINFVQTLPCVRCMTKYKEYYEDSKSVTKQSHAHHIRLKTFGGIALKPGDDNTLSLCSYHHFYLHKHGERKFWDGREDDAVALAHHLYDLTGKYKPAFEAIKDAGL